MKHFSEEQFVEWASGERGEESAQHLRECSACRAEVTQLNSALEGFRTEIKDLSEARVPFTGAQIRALANTAAQPSRSLWKMLPVPALAGVAVLAVMLWKPAPPVQAPATDADAADNALLLAINSDVYRSTPPALSPAASLSKERNQRITSSQRKK